MAEHPVANSDLPLENVAPHQASVLNAGGGGTRSSTPHFGTTNRCMIATIVYFALLLDNVLLTVIVPILPDYLATLNNRTYHTTLEMTGDNAAVPTSNTTINGDRVHAFQLPLHNLAYRNLDNHTPLLQSVITKHPIPGKSMVNFSLLHVDDKVLLAPNEHKQLRYGSSGTAANNIINGVNGAAITPKSATTGNTTGANNTTTTAVMSSPERIIHKTTTDNALANENGSIGVLLAMKALVQLIFNPIVGNMSTKLGYRLPIVAGTFILLMASLVFAVGETYMTLLLARAIQGVGSACIGVCGMSLVAQHYPEEDRRSKVMGIILGSIALGVLLGYPFGGILYDLVGKSAPFIILSTIIFLNLGMQLLTMDLSVQPEVAVDVDQQQPKWRPLLESKMILAIVVAIWFSTSTMAILEPCLPIWLIQHLHPNKWQLGAVFIPDSVGYFVGTNFFGGLAYKFGQVKISCIALLLVGISSILIPSAPTLGQLLLPHFALGLSIGIIDAALVPLLASFVDATLTQEELSDAGEMSTMSSYGTVYAIQQTSVSLAYCLAPLLGGELAQAFGFTWLMRIVGCINIAYGPILVFLHQKYNPKTLREKQNEMLLTNTGTGSQYKQLYNSVDADIAITAMATKPIGPGPGAYQLPPTVGYEKHDNRKLRLPQYSFGMRTQLYDKGIGPGPGAYKVDKLTRYGISKGYEYTIQGRTYLKDKGFGPGPGAHDVHCKPFFKGVNAPAYSISWRTSLPDKSCSPGPNAYKVDVNPIKPGRPAFSMGARTGLQDKPNSPGPAAYGPGNLNVKMPKPPEYSMTGRTMFNWKGCGPGPNNYNLMYYRPGKSGQAYSFGIRHNEYSPPMIVKCDNM